MLPEAWNFEPKRIAHELGHAIGWPHSFSGLREDSFEYDNPLDVMSATLHRDGPLRGRPQGTPAVNRLAAGWLDDSQVAVAGQPREEHRIVPLGDRGTQLVIILTDDPELFVALDARVSRGYDTGIGKEGVALHLIDQRPTACGRTGEGCFGHRRGTQPLLSGSQVASEYHHVLAPGDAIEYEGHRIEVTKRTGDTFHTRILTSEQPTGPIATVHPRSPGDSELATQTLDLFAEAGLVLPPVDIHFADNPGPCEGNAGLHLSTHGRSRIDVCEMHPALRRHALLHEVAHAWATTLDSHTRDSFLALRNLASWRHDDWQIAGTEHAAEIITWGLRSQPCWHPLRITDRDHDTLTEAFELLTGTNPRCDTTTPEPPPQRPDTILA